MRPYFLLAYFVNQNKSVPLEKMPNMNKVDHCLVGYSLLILQKKSKKGHIQDSSMSKKENK